MPRKSNTRAAQGTGTIRKKTVTRSGREYTYWEARYTAGIDPGTGRQVQRSITGKTQKEVAQKLREITAAIDAGTYTAPSKMTVAQWLDIWAAEYLGNVKPFTVRSYSDQIRNHINPADACALPRSVRKELAPLDEEQIRAFLQAIQGQRFETLFTVTLFTGLREGEVLGLTWDCVDFTKGTILVSKQLQREKKKGGAYVFAPLKNDKTRMITPAPWVLQLLRTHRAKQAELRLKAGPLWEDSGLVFTNEFGHHLAIHTVYKDFKKAAAAIGRPDARFHDLRHSYAVAAIRSGDDIKTVQGNLGHATAAFTLDVYGHVTEQMKQASAARMEGYIKDVLNL